MNGANRKGKSDAEGDNDAGAQGGEDHGGMEKGRPMYARFIAMVTTSTVAMFLLTYTNAFACDHVWWSEERVYMALLMGSCMAIIMMAFMWGMFSDRRLNLVFIGAAVMIGVSALVFSRSQALVDDRAYMMGMIPHHSIAILTSERAEIDDPRVRELADEIIEAQRREIQEMEWLINDINENGIASESEARERPVPEFEASP